MPSVTQPPPRCIYAALIKHFQPTGKRPHKLCAHAHTPALPSCTAQSVWPRRATAAPRPPSQQQDRSCWPAWAACPAQAIVLLSLQA
eukprot:1161439-Pelagomonas_calceolata.AAC.6